MFSSAWEKVRIRSTSFNHFDLIWYHNCSPKMFLCLLRTILGKLPTRIFLRDLNIIDSDQCLLCNLSTESINHLFFGCPFSSYIWQLCKSKLGINAGVMGSLLMEAVKIQTTFREKRNLQYLSELFYVLQFGIFGERERNERVFHQQSRDSWYSDLYMRTSMN